MNQEIDGVRKVYHYLHNCASGTTDAVRKNDLLVFSLPNPNWQERNVAPEAEYCLQIDPRDQKTLVVFDGHIPAGGLSKNTEVRLIIPRFMTLKTKHQYLRKPRLEEEFIVHYPYNAGCGFFELGIDRYFLLVPKVRICVRRYDNKSFRPIYTFVEITDKKVVIHPNGIIWNTTSY